MDDLPPDWAQLIEEIRCPMCEYNLRGLTESRCPECGFRFQWVELLDPIRRSHPYLFEHYPGRNLWSLGRTIRGGMQPGKFWRSLHPAQPSRPFRIFFYAIITMLPLFVACAVQIGLGTAAESAWRSGTWISTGSSGWVHSGGRISMTLLALNFQKWMENDQLSQFMLICLLWPWLTLIALNVFRWSMRRARIRRVHVLRTVVYSADMALWVSPMFLVMVVLFWINITGRGGSRWPLSVMRLRYSFFNPIFPFAAEAMLAIFSYRLIQAYRHYLRFDHAVATVLCAQTMVFLGAWKLLLVMQGK